MDSAARLKDLAVSDSGFVFDPYTGSTFSVNETGQTILAGLKSGDDRNEILSALRTKFEPNGADLDRDIDDFVEMMRHEGLLDQAFTV